ncbi:MAG: DMT family transporter [Tractidigestivibacter sp.]|uniref:DMT family transporter n=1 Tax=Tractidigestivibacter sp. TaxID=2847320 RepID=UPI002A80A2E3|nr:DMT family transporter [Tractidigestivibacter sp.]MDY4534706.1 DMT family transporter [Tractidigestivibacter sp.]
MSHASRKYLLSLLVFGSNGIVASQISLPSWQIVLLRTLLGGALLALLVLGARKRPAFLDHPCDAARLAASGAALGVGWIFLFEAYRLIGVGIASLAYYCGPVIVMALSPTLFHERLTAAKLLGFAAVVCGAFLVVAQGQGAAPSPLGLVCGGMSAVMYAVMVICSKRASDAIVGIEASAIQLVASFAAVAVFALVAHGSELAVPLSANWPAILCLGLVNTGLGCYLYFSAMGQLPVQRVSVWGYLEPLSAVILSALILGEALTPANVAGTAFILGGAIFCEVAGGQPRKVRVGRRLADSRSAGNLAA